MKDYKVHYLTAVPAKDSIGPHHLALVKVGANRFRLFSASADGTIHEIYSPDIEGVVRKVNGTLPNAAGEVVVELEYNSTNGNFKTKGGTVNVNLDGRYVLKTTYEAEIAKIWAELADKASLSKDNIFKGNNTFEKPVTIPDGINIKHAVNKGQLDKAVEDLMEVVAEGLRVPKPFDASKATVFPTAKRGDTFKVTGLGPGEYKVVGGVHITNNDTLIYDADGNKPFVLQSAVDQGTETIMGIYKVAKDADVKAGTSDTLVITPLKLKKEFKDQLEGNLNDLNNKFVRFDALQPHITEAQKVIAQTNIGVEKAFQLGKSEW